MAKPTLFFDNLLADPGATVTASSTDSGYAVRNLYDWRAYTWWKPTAMPASVTIDCGADRQADFALIHTHNLGTLMSSDTITVQVRASSDNFAASDELIATLAPQVEGDDAPLLAVFDSPQIYRYWRIVFVGDVVPSIAIAAIGQAFELPEWLSQGFDPLGRTLEGQGNTNEKGQPLGRSVQFESWTQPIVLERISSAWLRSQWMPAWRARLRGQPFVFGWDYELAPTELILVTAGERFASPHYSGGLCDLSFDLSGVAS
ncbi:hypothetical protein P3G55_18845 [Leptospira sp. 96542]|nr:hypothetical protein [Leptospira sp. 96542]